MIVAGVVLMVFLAIAMLCWAGLRVLRALAVRHPEWQGDVQAADFRRWKNREFRAFVRLARQSPQLPPRRRPELFTMSKWKPPR